MLRSKTNPVCRVFPGTHQQLSVVTAGGRRGVSLTYKTQSSRNSSEACVGALLLPGLPDFVAAVVYKGG